eukprot:GHRR01006329.1.p1 GENE.GHRR01006329.1~~GHRR01006329.1.p1  ORF type:complete len:156 (-),score=46.38 GHRR01006329.1:610-1077(-)
MIMSGWPGATDWPFSTHTFTTSPPTSASISFISFIASMMHTVCPFFTRSPSFTNGGSPGAGALYIVPDIGLATSMPSTTAGAAGLGAGAAAGAAVAGAAEAGVAAGAAAAACTNWQDARAQQSYHNLQHYGGVTCQRHKWTAAHMVPVARNSSSL